MKNTILLSIFSFLVGFSFAQTEPIKPVSTENPKAVEEPVLTFVDEDASFSGGQLALNQWINATLVYPPTAIKNKKSGKVYVTFVVEKDGAISNVEILKGISDCEECNKEVIRVISLMPKWIPAKLGQKNVRARCNLPINFTL